MLCDKRRSTRMSSTLLRTFTLITGNIALESVQFVQLSAYYNPLKC